MQTILGAGRTIGKETARELLHYTNRIRLVSRRPKKVNHSDEAYAADLLDMLQKAGEENNLNIEGSPVPVVADI